MTSSFQRDNYPHLINMMIKARTHNSEMAPYLHNADLTYILVEELMNNILGQIKRMDYFYTRTNCYVCVIGSTSILKPPFCRERI